MFLISISLWVLLQLLFCYKFRSPFSFLNKLDILILYVKVWNSVEDVKWKKSKEKEMMKRDKLTEGVTRREYQTWNGWLARWMVEVRRLRLPSITQENGRSRFDQLPSINNIHKNECKRCILQGQKTIINFITHYIILYFF